MCLLFLFSESGKFASSLVYFPLTFILYNTKFDGST